MAWQESSIRQKCTPFCSTTCGELSRNGVDPEGYQLTACLTVGYYYYPCNQQNQEQNHTAKLHTMIPITFLDWPKSQVYILLKWTLLPASSVLKCIFLINELHKSPTILDFFLMSSLFCQCLPKPSPKYHGTFLPSALNRSCITSCLKVTHLSFSAISDIKAESSSKIFL